MRENRTGQFEDDENYEDDENVHYGKPQCKVLNKNCEK